MVFSLHSLASSLSTYLLLSVAFALQAQARVEDKVSEVTITPPKPLALPSPIYPEDVANRDFVVDVTLLITINESGQVEAAEVQQVSPEDAPASFHAQAKVYVQKLEFIPAQADGKAIAVQFPFRVHFAPPPQEVPTIQAIIEQSSLLPPSILMTEGKLQQQVDIPTPAKNVSDASSTADASDLDIDVIGERDAKPPRSASDFDIDVGKLRQVPRRNAEDYLTLAPGIMLTNHGGVGHPSAIFLRGFNAQEGQDLEFLVDGVPINEVANAHGHGLADTHFVLPELIDRIEVIEGPFAPSQGDFAVAGSARYHLGLEQRGVRMQGAYGSFNHRRAMLLWGPQGQKGGTYVGADFTAGDGFGINRAYRSARLNAGYEQELKQGLHLRTHVHAYGSRFDNAGVLRQDDVEAGRVQDVGGVPCEGDVQSQRFCTYDPNQGGAMLRVGGHLTLERIWGRRSLQQTMFASHKTMRIRENFTGFRTDPPTVQRPDGDQRGDGAEQSYLVTTAGARGSYRTSATWWRKPQDLELGWILRFDGGDSTQKRLERASGNPYRIDFDHRLRILNLGAYVGGTLRPHHRLDLNLGGRLDGFIFSVNDRTPRPDRLGILQASERQFEAFGLSIQPRASLVVQATPWLDWLAAYGMGTRSSDATGLSDGEFAPFARVQAAETGFHIHTPSLGDRLNIDSRIVGFYTHVDRDLVFDPTAGRNLFQGSSHRFGTLASLRLNFAGWFDWLSSFTWTEAYCQPDPQNQLPQNACGTETEDISPLGRRLPFIPRFVVRSDAALFHEFNVGKQAFSWSIGPGFSYVSPRPLPNNLFGTPMILLDIAAHMRWRFIELGASFTNILNVRYNAAEFYYASNFEDPSGRGPQLPVLHFAAGAPFQAMGTLTFYFEPSGPASLPGVSR